MKMIIYHQKKMTRFLKAEPVNADDVFIPVGEINYPGFSIPANNDKVLNGMLEIAFNLTNSKEYHWSKESPNVWSYYGMDVRSTSVGDIVKICSDDTYFYMVDGCGYRKLDFNELNILNTIIKEEIPVYGN
jgi:hypothetical protein